MSSEELYKRFNRPWLQPVERLDKKPLPKSIPRYAVQPVWLGEKSELIPLSDAEIFLADFGESFLPSTTSLYSPDSYPAGILFPPEAYFLPREPFSFPLDIWDLACAIWEVIGFYPLFTGVPTVDKMVEQHVDLLGKLPPEWWQRWDARSKVFNDEGVRIDRTVRGPHMGSFEKRFKEAVQVPRRKGGMEEVSEEEKAALLKMLKAMMAFKPGDRMTAEQIIKSEWMEKWALPELSRLKEAKGHNQLIGLGG
jgi:serine/threonine-protein kinase SRPK3